MGHSDYPLQALLYAVVLHRFLRWRVSDYDPELHLGGVLYLYLRGVDGEGHGVHTERLPLALIEAMDALFAEGTPDHAA
jgi:exodeoxyribonuclease V beta subunit